MRTAALAGASGFLGRRTAEALIAAGWRVRALVRRAADATTLAKLGVDTVLGELSNAESLATLTDNVEVTINCAGRIKARDRGAFFADNSEGAARLARIAPSRIVLISSLAAREPGLSDYAASKRAGEEASRDAAGTRLAIIRPPVIYGPGDRETLALFRVAEWLPIAPLPGKANARLAMAHVDDVASTILDLALRPDLDGVYAAGGDRPSGYAWSEIAHEAWRAVGRVPNCLPTSSWMVMAAAAASEAASHVTRSAHVFTRGKAREMLHPDWSVSDAELVPNAPPARFSLRDGFADAVSWYRAEGWL